MNVRDNDGWTPLMWASMYNHDPEVIKTLLAAGADMNARNSYGWTPLMYASMYNHDPEVITTLLAAGADAKAKDNRGYTAFSYAQYNEKLKGTLKDTAAYQKLEEASK